MISRSRIRIVVITMMFLIFIVVSTLGIIYGTTRIQTTKENKEMLHMFAKAYDENGFPDSAILQPSPQKASDDFTPTTSFHNFQVSTFYAVAFDLDGNVIEYLNDAPSGFSNEALVEYASNLLKSGKDYGEGNSVTYLITKEDDYILVTMMDTVLMDLTISYLIKNMIVFGGISILILLMVSIILSKWVVKPIETAYEKQKQFISDAGHELKTPISTISANAEILGRNLLDNPWLENIKYENEKMSTIVHQLLDLARLENIKPTMSEVNLSELVLANILPFEASAYENNLELNYDISNDIIKVCDKTNMEKLISILIDNAISHCSPNGKINITLTEESGKIMLKVANTGEEIPENEREKIFERFYRSDYSRAERVGHYGLGLSIAQTIALEHNGKIWVDCIDGNVIFNLNFR